MTSPATEIEITCPKCSRKFKGWYRPSINLGLGEKWTEADIRRANSSKCPGCKTVVEVGSMVVAGDGTFRLPDPGP